LSTWNLFDKKKTKNDLINLTFDCFFADILQGNFKPDYYLKHIQKDLRLAISMGDSVNHPTPMAAAANEVRQQELFWSVICESIYWIFCYCAAHLNYFYNLISFSCNLTFTKFILKSTNNLTTRLNVIIR